MLPLKETVQDFSQFTRAVSLYTQKRLKEFSVYFEAKKQIIVAFLVTKRGTYQRPFLHTSIFVLIGIGIVAAPMIHTTYPAVANQLEEFTPPSAVLSSLDEQETLTQISEKPRDSVITHSVKEGDTLASLGQHYGVSVDTIKWANPKLEGEKLSIGQELSIPPVTGVVVKVGKGDTIYSLATKYKTDAQKILNFPFNNFQDLDTFALAAGQTLIIPDGVMPEAKPIYSPKTIAHVGKGAPQTGSGQFVWPTNGMITQRPVFYHMAYDIANPSLPNILAADGGKVVQVERGRYGYGQHIIVDHGNGYQTLYAHMSQIFVSVGQSVGRGAAIGKMGSTGRSTGSHLHFEIRKGGVLLNPANFLK